MNIGVDARPLVEKKTGFGYFLENMLNAILKEDITNTYYLFSDREVFFDAGCDSNVKIVRYNDKIYCPKSFYYYYRLADFINRQGIKLDVFWGTEHLMPRGFANDVKKILTIHDFTHIKFPKSTTKYNLFVSKLLFGSSIKNADDIVCISENSERELRDCYPERVKGKNILTIYEGGFKDSQIGKISYDIMKVQDIIKNLENERFVLFVGTIEPRKNISLLIKAAPKLKSIAKVVVCGKVGWESRETIDKLKNTENLIYLNYISQDEKAFLMKHAFCQVQPSLYEGFGLPVVESMQSGTCVLVADNSSLSELVEMEELRFETGNVEMFIHKIRLLLDDSIYHRAKIYCNNRGKQFSWKQAAEKYITLWSRYDTRRT